MPARRRAIALVGTVCALVMTACAEDAPQDTWQPEGPNAQKIHNLQWPVFAVAGVVGVIVFAAIIYEVVKFKDRGQPIPKQTHGKPALEIGLTIVPALILIGVAVPTVGTLLALAETDDTECSVNVYGQQWWWEVEYPQQDGCGGISEEFVTSGQMVIPTGTKVLISGTSRDVIHSWWVPALNGKRDLGPGRVHTLRTEADDPGIYAGQCTEFCGLSHANMKMEIVALAPD
ncbi:MAG: cytochrome c oxidase subunit II, partial [Actinomycetota bacterium]|nr:cytochrome c oxidase subunit II [Actinomycetota bacterium]